MRSSLRDKATKGAVQEAGQDESDFDPNKVRTGRKPKKNKKMHHKYLMALR